MEVDTIFGGRINITDICPRHHGVSVSFCDRGNARIPGLSRIRKASDFHRLPGFTLDSHFCPLGGVKPYRKTVEFVGTDASLRDSVNRLPTPYQLHVHSKQCSVL